MKKQQHSLFMPIIVSLIAGLFIGYLIAADRGPSAEMENHEHATDLPHAHGEHAHGMFAYEGDNPPSVDLEIFEDPKSGWNIYVSTQNFRFDPEAASTEHVEGAGHAHLYIDGKKITRLYSDWFYIPELEAGEHEIKVDLNTNDHKTYAVAGEMVMDTETLVVS